MTTPSPSPSPPSPPLTLRHLLAACVSAGVHAGAVIREVVGEDHDLQLVSKCADKYDPQTVADRRSQQRMIHALRHVWPHVRIVGEEGDLDHADDKDRVLTDLHVLDAALPATTDAIVDRELDAARVVVWIDPLDGTKKFAEKKFDEVSVLLGIALDERPLAGVMHLPFDSDPRVDGATLWGTSVLASLHRCV
ncbi:hypothetical protein PINS_up005418 [Pythium insidiosum]|nr:hypothetical protein PINS_up005418 [Pythium insidiosum]